MAGTKKSIRQNNRASEYLGRLALVAGIHPADNGTEQDGYVPMLHGRATDAIAVMAGQQAEVDEMVGMAQMGYNEVKLIIDNFSELNGTLGISTHKLLSVAIAQFTANADSKKGVLEARQLRVTIPLKDYALACGYDVEERTTETEEESKAEALRIRVQFNNLKRKLKKDITLLASCHLDWEEKVCGESQDFSIARILSGGKVKSGLIQIELGLSIAEYLIRLPLTQYPTALLSVDERNPNAYSMGLKMAEYYSMNSYPGRQGELTEKEKEKQEQRKKRAEFLKVSTLLAVTSLPDISDIQKHRRSWKGRIRSPFEASLDLLVSCGLLEKWEYVYDAGSRGDWDSGLSGYTGWSGTLVHFILKDHPHRTGQLNLCDA